MKHNRRKFPRGAIAAPLVVAALAMAATAAFSGFRPEDQAPDRTAGPAPIFNNLGNFTKPVSTKSALAQRYFDQGMMFVYGFNHKEAIRSFEAAATVDPELAVAWWGASFAYGPNINAPMEGDAVPPAIDALHKAQALADHAAPWERAYIDALATRYSEDPNADRATLDLAYAEAMGRVAREYPDDMDAAVLRADAVMNTMAWDYWLPDRKTPKPATREVIAGLQQVLRKNPDHPGANHALIHLVEAGPEPWTGIPSAKSLRFLAPDAGHLVHMPSHIYMRVGEYHEAVLANERAATADKAYIAQCRAQGFYPGAYYPHNEHFLWWAFTFQGRRADAYEKAAEIIKLANNPMCGTPVVEKPRFTHLNLLTAVRFGDSERILEAQKPDDEEALDLVMWHWARATAFAAKGDRENAAKEAAATRAIADGNTIEAMDNPYLPAIAIANIAAHLAEGRAAAVQGNLDEAIDHYTRAVDAEDSMPYMEPAFWFYPTRQTLGAALLAAGRNADAEEIFRADLEIWPRNAWSLNGLATATARQGKQAEAQKAREAFSEAWKFADVKPVLAAY